ncbi:hypothetical protein [Limnobacter sp.]|uniref:hypothetical protein n=1 Tax=Limnobacter sp. TaxID=2003368 RepID=UPI0025867142|nr:hypothetical protein [Limnobacter sp.]HEX5486430.1 hypothetical protein [Limnobacter sp.]
MNRRSLFYLVMASATLAIAFLYTQTRLANRLPAVSAPSTGETAQALPSLVIRDGKPVGGPLTLRANKGDSLKVLVQSNTTGEIHVHGLELTFPVQAGQSSAIELPTTQTGAFEIELHPGDVPLGALEVHPN